MHVFPASAKLAQTIASGLNLDFGGFRVARDG
jgi:hypothetical protein